MVLVTVMKRKDGGYAGFSTTGHAEYAKPGKDIVCAAISILITNTVNSIEAFAKDDIIHCKNEDETGHIEFTLTPSHSGETKVLMDSMILGLRAISKEYGGRYLKVLIKEV